jgi:DNA-directed RNA polymerase subunit beta'
MGEGRVFGDFDDVMLAFDNPQPGGHPGQGRRARASRGRQLREGGRKLFRVREGKSETEDIDVTDGPKRFETTVGRIIFNRQCLPADYPFMNYKMSKGDISALVNDCCDRYSGRGRADPGCHQVRRASTTPRAPASPSRSGTP